MNPPIRYLQAWRVLRLGTRDVIDAIVAPDAPAEAFENELAAFEGAHYWVDDARTHLVLVKPIGPARREPWVRSFVLLGLTLLFTLGAGAALAGTWLPVTGPGILGALAGSLDFYVDVLRGNWGLLLQGWSFALPLVGILLVHELGHYMAARRYAIDVTPPFFLPIPPTLSPIGSLGAFIRLRTPVLDRRQLLDVGAAGPLAGFAVALAVLIWGFLTSERLPIVATGDPSYVVFNGQAIFLGESLLTMWLRDWLLPGQGAVHLSLPGFAGWVGAFVTGLNLIPLSQLDGGHVLYGLFGRKQAVIGVVTVVGLLLLAQFSPMWYIWVVLSLLVGGGRFSHPSVLVPERTLPASRRWIGWACIILFAMTFVPLPFVN